MNVYLMKALYIQHFFFLLLKTKLAPNAQTLLTLIIIITPITASSPPPFT